jgi:hypothetical protein
MEYGSCPQHITLLPVYQLDGHREIAHPTCVGLYMQAFAFNRSFPARSANRGPFATASRRTES